MQKAYKDLDIQFLPDNLLTELNQQRLSTTLISDLIHEPIKIIKNIF